MRVLVTGATGLIGSAVCDALLARGDEVVGLSRDPPTRPRAPTPPSPGTPGIRPPSARRTPRSRASTRSSTWSARRSTSGSPTRPSSGSATAACGRPRTSSTAILAATPSPAVARQPGGDRHLRRPRRGDRRRVDPRRPRASCPGRGRVGGRGRAGAEAAGVRVVVLRTGLLLDPDGGLLKQLRSPFKLGVGGPLAGGDYYMPLDPPRRRGRADPLGARQRERQRDDERHRSEPGHQPRVLEGARQGPAPAVVHARRPGSRSSRCAARSSPSRSPAATGSIPRRALDLGYAFRFTELEPALRDLLESLTADLGDRLRRRRRRTDSPSSGRASSRRVSVIEYVPSIESRSVVAKNASITAPRSVGSDARSIESRIERHRLVAVGGVAAGRAPVLGLEPR